MVNTVGSHENKYWQKKWIPIKQSLVLSCEQKALVIGSILGDGTMRLGQKAKNANFKVEQGLAQKEYVKWKYQILKPLVFSPLKISYRYRDNGEKYPKSWWFRTIRHPLLTQIYHRFYEGNGYKNGRKIIPLDIKTDLNPFTVAVWIMDDGNYSKQSINISTYCFALAEVNLLNKCFKELFNIEAKYYQDRDKGYRIYCNQRETKKLIEIIRPYIIPSMKYKIGDS